MKNNKVKNKKIKNNIEQSKDKKSSFGCGTIIVVFIVLLLIGRCGKNDSIENSETDTLPITTQSTEIETHETKTTETTTAPITTTTTAKVRELSELEILKLKNHPKFFSSAETAETVWADYLGEESVMIKYSTTHHYKYENAILVLDCYKTNGLSHTDSNIRGVSIRFNNFKKDEGITFEEGIELAKEYFPNDIISEHYTLNASFYQITGNIGKEYTIEYKLNDSKDEEKYSDFVSIVLCTNESGTMRTLDINCERNGQSRFESEKFEWNYDFLSEESIILTKAEMTTTITTTEVTSAVTEPPTEAPTPEPPSPAEPVIAESNYVLNTSTMKAHKPNCRDVGKIDAENRLDYYGTVEDVQSMGYSSCGHCHTW